MSSTPNDVQEYITECIEGRPHRPIPDHYDLIGYKKEPISKEYEQALMLATYFLAYGYAQDNQLVKDDLTRFFNFDAIPNIIKGSSIAANIFLIKMPSHGLKITTPDWLIYLIETCANGLPGFMQLIYKELLVSINKIRFNNLGIPENYCITADDFAWCFPDEFPIIENPVIMNKYEKLWDDQKLKKHKPLQSDNICDTNEYWLEVTKYKK